MTMTEELAQKVHGYVELIEDTSAELRKNPSEYHPAYSCVVNSPFTAQPGQATFPPREERQAFIEYLDNIRQVIPTCDDE
jgi:hypothetical protein